MSWSGVGEIFNPGQRHLREELDRKQIEAKIPGDEGEGETQVDLENNVVRIAQPRPKDPRDEETPVTSLTEDDLRHLRRCIELAREALQAGDEPFGSVLVDADGMVRAEDRNRTAGGDQTRHPEFELARWSSTNLTPEERHGATVYTSGEHCAMCSAAHAWVGLGRIVYVASTEQLLAWRRDLGLTSPSPVNPLPVHAVAPGVIVGGPAMELEDEIRELHRRHAETAAQDPIT